EPAEGELERAERGLLRRPTRGPYPRRERARLLDVGAAGRFLASPRLEVREADQRGPEEIQGTLLSRDHRRLLDRRIRRRPLPEHSFVPGAPTQRCGQRSVDPVLAGPAHGPGAQAHTALYVGVRHPGERDELGGLGEHLVAALLDERPRTAAKLA